MKIDFSYIPDYDLITTYLQQWSEGIYFQATVDVAFTAPGVAAKRRESGIISSSFKSVSRLAKATYADIVSADRVSGKSISFTLDELTNEELAAVKNEESESVPKAVKGVDKAQEKLLEQVKEKNDKMIVAAVASVGGALLIAFIAAIIVVAIILRKKN